MLISTPCRPLLVRLTARRPVPQRYSVAMFSAIKTIFGGGGRSECTASCGACDPKVLAKCQAPEAGSVTPHMHHVLVRLPPVSGAAKEIQEHGAWWPESVDKEPAIEAANAAIKQNQDRIGKVKVTAFDDLAPSPSSTAPDSYEVLVFPAAVKLSGVPLDRVGEAVVGALTQAGSEGSAGQQEALGGVTLLICCHGKRDSRCGVLGTQLATRLVQLLEEKGLGAELRVLKTSHVGGHVYAGNVLVYGKASACDGDWFGGVNADNAADFLDALLSSKVPGSANPQLRRLWRGRVGLSKDEQKALFEEHAAGIKDIEDLK